MELNKFNQSTKYFTRSESGPTFETSSPQEDEGFIGFREEFEKGGSPKGPRLPITAEEDKIANIQYGKPMKDLPITQRTDLRKRIRLGKVDTITFEQYLEDFKGMANDPDYKPKYVKGNVGIGASPQQRRARAEAKNTIEGFESKFSKNISRRKRIKMKAAMEANPERKQREMAKKAERRRKRRAEKLGDKRSLTQSEKLLNFEQSLITRQLNDKIKANPKLITDNIDLMDKLSTTVDGDGNIIKSKPTLYEIEKRGLFEIEHQRDVRKKGAMKDFPYNRNPILAPFNRSGGFKDMAEKFIEKNPDPNNPKVRNIIEKANELKITLQPQVPEGIFKTKGLGYKQPGSATGKFIDYANFYLPELVDDKIGIAGYTGNREMLERGLKAKRPTQLFSGAAALPEMARLGGEVLTQDIPKASSVVEQGLKNLRLLRPIAYETGFGAAFAPVDFVSGRPMSEILLDIPTLGIAGQTLRAQRLRQTVGPEVFDKIQEQRAARSEGVGGIESAMFEDFDIDETPLEEAIQARADREAEVAKKRQIEDVSESDVFNIPKQDPKTGLRNLPSDIEDDLDVL